MNDQMTAILLKIAIALKRMKWKASQNWELELKSEGKVSLLKDIEVEGSMGSRTWTDDIETYIELKMTSDDQLTFFPEYTIYGNIHIEGGGVKDIAYKLNSDVAFTIEDLNNDSKTLLAAQKLNRLVEQYVEKEYTDYIEENSDDIQQYTHGGGWKEDPESHSER